MFGTSKNNQIENITYCSQNDEYGQDNPRRVQRNVEEHVFYVNRDEMRLLFLLQIKFLRASGEKN
jgi:hypothetical protein